MAANGLKHLQHTAGALARVELSGIVAEDNGRRLVALIRPTACDGECAVRRVVIRHADQVELAGLAEHERQEIRDVLAEHAQRMQAAAA